MTQPPHERVLSGKVESGVFVPHCTVSGGEQFKFTSDQDGNGTWRIEPAREPNTALEDWAVDKLREVPHGQVTFFMQDSEIVRCEKTESEKPRG